jgi:LPS-assembly protein
MKLRILGLLLLFIFPGPLAAQLTTFGDEPIEITSDGETRFEGGIAIAENNVVIHYGDLAIYCDYAQYNPDTRDVLVRGNVRVYQGKYAFVADRAVYNLETKILKAADFGGAREPFQITGDTLSSISNNEYIIQNGLITTSDRSEPDWHIRARKIRVYPDDRIILSNITLFVGQTPVFWFPYLYQSLNDEFSFQLSPGYSSRWGAYLLTATTFPLSERVSGTFRLDLRTERGVAGGFDVNYEFGEDNETYGRLQTYFTYDLNPNINETSLARSEINDQRYRVSYQARTFITSDLTALIDFNLLSDQFLLEDFYPGEFSTNPQPDNVFQLQLKGEAYTLTGLLRYQVNDFQETTERLPEVSWEVTRTPLFNSPIFYEATTSAGWLRRNFPDEPPAGQLFANPDYESFRFDTFHQFLFPKTYFKWLSIIPRVGIRASYYENTGTIVNVPNQLGQLVPTLFETGPDLRLVFNAGVEVSFKLSRAYEGAQVRWAGLDGLRHIIQPYTNFSYVSDPTLRPEDILQFDRFIPSSQIAPIDFPQFVSIDAIDKWTIWRLGVRNRLQTRRNNQTLNWLELDTFFDVNFDNPFDDTDFSNVYNRLRFNPVPWLGLTFDSQLPLLDDGFTELNTSLAWTLNERLHLTVGHRYINDFQFFQNSNLITFRAYFRINENWGFSVYEEYEAEDGILQVQQYTLHRDLSSWVASFGLISRDNRDGKQDIGIALTLTLKDLPQFSFPVDLDPGALAGGGSSDSE